MAQIVLEFQDHGQDFLRWLVDAETGNVEDCAPFQLHVWGQYRILNPDLQPGDFVTIQHKIDESIMTIKYPVTEVTRSDDTSLFIIKHSACDYDDKFFK
jgi:hypothetical protein